MDKLGAFSCLFSVDGVESVRNAEVFTQFDKHPDLLVRIPFSKNERIPSFILNNLRLKIDGSEWVDCVPSDSDDPGDFIQVMPLRSPIVIDTNEKLSKLSFSIGDLPNLRSQLNFANSEWSLTISRFPTNAPLRINGEENARAALTHRGTLERPGGTPFSAAEASRCLIHICRYFSFCYERWVSVANVEGFNAGGTVVFWQLGAGKLDPARADSNWLDGIRPETALQEFFPGFMSKIALEGWEQTIDLVVYWYIRGNSSTVGPDGSLILLQAALERLAWQFLVQDARVLSEDGFNKLAAADTLRLLLAQNHIPLKIPAEQAKLIAIGKGLGWNDGADAVVQTRNRIVHPPKKKGNSVKLDFHGAYTIAKWYIELILLHLGNFNGNYSNRTLSVRWKGQTEPVPWRA